MKKLLLLLFFLLGQLIGMAQEKCPYFEKYLIKGDSALEKEDFKLAFNSYNIAMLHCPAEADSARSKIDKAFKKIEALKDAAVIALGIAERARDSTKLAQAETLAALQKAKKLIDAFYFYKDRFALAYNYGQFYFIDTLGSGVEKLDSWDIALPFKEKTLNADVTTGYAEVKKKNRAQDNEYDTYLLDTLGNQYLIGNDFRFQHYLNFNGRNHVEVPAASKYIAGAEGITMAGWFYFDRLDKFQGLMGFRNSDGDIGFKTTGTGDGEMYLITLPDGKLECRFIVSGQLSEVVTPANTVRPRIWQHYAWVYDGSQVALFLNGEKIGSAPATAGTITSTDTPFSIGRLVRNNALVGNVDEVSLWSRALTQSEIQLLMEDELESTESGLELYYHFNQGVPYGDNRDIKKITSAVGNGERDGNLSSTFQLQGTRSNFAGGEIQALDLSKQSLTSIPPGVFKQGQINFLFLNNNALDHIPTEIGQLSNLIGLDLSGNQIDTLTDELGKLKKLTALDLSSNRLNNLTAEIGQLKQLTILDLSDNNFKELPPEIGGLTNLNTLYLSGNELTRLPAEIENLEKLTTLYLSGNELSDIPPEIGKLKNLTTLYLRNNKLNRLPAEIGDLSELTILDISGNHLDSLTTEIGQLKNLVALDLRNNQLPQLPTEIAVLEKLTDLRLRDNPWVTLPSNIEQLGDSALDISKEELAQLYQPESRLTLDFSGYNLTELPDEIGSTKDLTVLDLSGNQLTRLSPEITGLKKLSKLDLSFNQFSNWPVEIEELDNLTTLDLSGNGLTRLPTEINGLENLRSLDLGFNQLEGLPAEIEKLNRLTFLDLSNNRLTRLPAGISLLNDLDTLKLNNNLLTSLPAEIAQLNDLKYIQLQNNPLLFLSRSSCALLADKSDLEEEDLNLICNPESRTSLNLSGYDLVDLPAEIERLENLVTLNLGNNQLTGLPAQLGTLNSLDTLDLSNNQFRQLPPEIESLANLSYLNLSNNGLTELPAEIGKFKDLGTLDLRGNQLTTLPNEIRQLENVKSILLDGNPIASLSKPLYEFIAGKSDLSIAQLDSLFTDPGVILSLENRKLSLQIQKHLPKFNERSRAIRYFERRKYDEAFQKQQEVLSVYQDNFYTWGNLSRFALFVNKPQEAIDAAKKAFDLNESWIDKVKGFQKFGYLLTSNQVDAPKAIRVGGIHEDKQVKLGLEAILNSDPIGLLSGKNNYLRTYQKQKEILEEEEYKNDFVALANLSHLALFINKPQEAIAFAQKALDINALWHKRVEGYLVLGHIFKDQWTDAEELLGEWDEEHIERFFQTRAALDKAGIEVPDISRMRPFWKEN